MTKGGSSGGTYRQVSSTTVKSTTLSGKFFATPGLWYNIKVEAMNVAKIGDQTAALAVQAARKPGTPEAATEAASGSSAT